MNEDKASRYHRLRRQASALSLGVEALLLVGLLATGASAALRDVAARAAGARPLAVVAVYVVLLAVLHEAVGLPLSLYRGLLLERRYGLSRETLGRWGLDHLKAAAIGLVFGLLGAVAVYALLRAAPLAWWVLAAALFTAATVGLAQLAPVVLLPLFYHVTPLDREALAARLTRLAERAGSRVLGVYLWHVGDRTRRANAALVGLGRTRRILVSDTLVAEYSDDEIEAILAHELAHHVHLDIWRAIAVEAVLIFGGFACADWALGAFGPRAGLAGPRRRRGPAAAAARERRRLGRAPSGGARALALAGAPRRPVRAGDHRPAGGVRVGHAPAGGAEPGRGRPVAARAGALLQPPAHPRAHRRRARDPAVTLTGRKRSSPPGERPRGPRRSSTWPARRVTVLRGQRASWSSVERA